MLDADWHKLVAEVLAMVEPDPAARQQLRRRLDGTIVLCRRLAEGMDPLALRRKLIELVKSET